MEATGQTVVVHGDLEDLLQGSGGVQGELLLDLIVGDLNLFHVHFNLGIVRHIELICPHVKR
jgi:hypothetical protein